MLLQLHWSLANLAYGKLAAEESEHSIMQQNTFDAVLSVFNFQQLYKETTGLNCLQQKDVVASMCMIKRMPPKSAIMSQW